LRLLRDDLASALPFLLGLSQVGRAMTQMDFFADRDKTIDERFREFDRENPVVYAHLERLAYEGVNAGMKKLGIRNLWEVMRWHVYMTTRDPSHLRLNDHYHSRYVRKLIDDHPDLEPYFELRKLRAA